MTAAPQSGINPWCVGQTSPTWTLPLPQGQDGWLNVSGVNVSSQVSLLIYSVTQGTNGVLTYTKIGTGQGIFTNLVVGPPSSVQYTPSTSDAYNLAAGNYAVRVQVNLSGALYMTYYIPMVVQP